MSQKESVGIAQGIEDTFSQQPFISLNNKVMFWQVLISHVILVVANQTRDCDHVLKCS